MQVVELVVIASACSLFSKGNPSTKKRTTQKKKTFFMYSYINRKTGFPEIYVVAVPEV
jgi:hypothetical protein